MWRTGWLMSNTCEQEKSSQLRLARGFILLVINIQKLLSSLGIGFCSHINQPGGWAIKQQELCLKLYM